jgi:hypothetical protein
VGVGGEGMGMGMGMGMDRLGEESYVVLEKILPRRGGDRSMEHSHGSRLLLLSLCFSFFPQLYRFRITSFFTTLF